jgi:hypothetical protein
MMVGDELGCIGNRLGGGPNVGLIGGTYFAISQGSDSDMPAVAAVVAAPIL